MAGVYNGGWVPFQDQMGRQGWYNQSTGQTTYQQYGAGAGGGMMSQMSGAMLPQQSMYGPQVPPMQMGGGYMGQMGAGGMMGGMGSMGMGGMSGWQTRFDGTGRRFYYNPMTGQSSYF